MLIKLLKFTVFQKCALAKLFPNFKKKKGRFF